MNYKEAWTYLDDLQFFKIKLGLDSMAAFLDSVGNPQDNLRFVHVAGTNGKGSVSITLLSMLAQAGYRVGLYTSPHLSSVRERFRINDHFISENEFAEHATKIRESLDGRYITYFEFTTALALLWFAEQEVDLVILEVGMGGRLDATNVVNPLISVITNVSMDHEAYLGDTLFQVSREKAGIIKSGVPVVSAVAEDESRDVTEMTCRLRGVPLYLMGREFTIEDVADSGWDYSPLKQNGLRLEQLVCSLLGSHQKENTAQALAVVELLGEHGFQVTEENIRQGLESVHWPARLEYFCLEKDAGDSSANASDFGKKVLCHPGPEQVGLDRYHFLIDGAHNPAGVESLARTLKDDFSNRDIILVWGSMSDKDSTNSLARLAPICQQIIFTKPAGERSAEAESLLKELPDACVPMASCKKSVKEALEKAMDLAGESGLVCVAGSLYLAGEARTLLLGELINHG